MKRKTTTIDTAHTKRPKAKEEDMPAPDMSLLHAPVEKGWGKEEWTVWYNGWKDENYEQLKDAIAWAAPDVITLTLSTLPSNEGEEAVVREFQLSKGGIDTWRSVIDEFCKAEGIDRDQHEWSLDDVRPGTFNNVELKCFDKCFNKIWWPLGYISRFSEDGITYGAKVTGRKKSPPRHAPPSDEPPSFDLFKSPPPEGDAPHKEWKAWLDENNRYDASLESYKFSIARKEAIEYRCPRKVTISLKGVSHDLDLAEFDADTPLSVALKSYCSVVPNGELIPADVILKDGSDEDCIYPERTPRSFFYGETTTFCFDVVYKDWERTMAELEAKRPVPEKYVPFRGSGYLLSEIEQPWLITEDGCETYDKILEEALNLYDNDRCYEKGYNSYVSWMNMMASIIRILGSIVRKPRSGWTVNAVMVAMDKLTAALLVLHLYKDWCRDCQGRIRLEEEGAKILRKMDTCAVKLIKETINLVEASATDLQQADGKFGIKDALDQLKRLMIKYKGCPSFSSHYNSPKVFSKALRLVEST